MAIPISNVTRRVVYAASGTGPYAFTFEILANTDIAVFKDDTLLTLTTDYTVTIASNGTGSITLVASPTGATQIAIVGNRTIQRTTDFVTGGDFFANTVNDEMDQQTIFAQQNAEGLQRALSAPQTDPTSINMTLPRASLRANKALGFDANGNPVIADTLGTNRGNWASGTLYYVRDIVKDTTNNNIWQAIVQHTSSGSQPINTNADSAKWTLLVDAASATTSATNAASSASAAATSASNASTSASNASTSATNAASSASTASTQATNAANSASAAAASYDSFDDRYLGTKASDPTVDNDGNALIDGALYFDTTNNVMKVYDLGTTTWKRTTPTTSDQANIDSAVANATNINTVATNIANVNATGGNIANVNAVAGNATNINAVVANATNINTVAGISANVTTVATNNANVTTVAGSIASVNTNATNIANINANAANITAIQNASANATAAASSATAAASSATSAASSAAAASAVVLGSEPVRPGIRPSLLLDFANTKQLDPRITFTRASTATYYGTQTAKAEENLLLQSQTFDNASWTKTRSTVTANDTAAPDGTTTADKIQQNAGATTAGLCQQSATSVSGSSYVISVFAKAGTNKNFLLVQDTLFTTAGSEVWFDVLNGTVGTIERPASHTASIVSVGNGWFRCIVQFTASVSNAGNVVFYAAQTDNTTTVTDDQGFIYLWGAQLEQRSAVTAYTATTTAPITNYIPQLLTAASGVARFDNNPTTFESLGLEIEESRTNLLTYSEQFDDASWTKANSTITANTIVAPDGALTCDKLVADATSNFHTVFRAFSFTSGTAYTLSIFAKAGEYQYLSLTAGNTGTFPARVTFDLISGTVSSTVLGTGSIQSVGNGWYRCSVSATATATASTGVNFAASSTGSYVTYTGNGYSGIYIWGAQLEAGAFATSYIPTVASQVTRAADSASMTGTNFSSWYNVGQGALYAEWIVPSSTASCNIFSISDGTTNNRYQQYSEAGLIVLRTAASGVAANNTIGTSVANTFIKTAFGYGSGSTSASDNGTVITTTTQALPSTLTAAYIGAGATAAVGQSVTIRKIAYYPLRVTDAQLQALTTV